MEHANKIYIALAAALLASTSAQAQQGESSWGLVGGYQRGATSSAGDSATVDLGGTPANVTIAGETDAPNGYFLGIVWDRQVSDHWTMGGELSYRNSSMDLTGRMSASAGGTTDTIPAGGDASLHTVALMANFWRYSAPSDSGSRFFVGGGIGAAHNQADGTIYATGTLLGTPVVNTTGLDESKTNLAWQLGAGWEFPLGDTTRGSLSYRYFNGGDVDDLDTSSHGVVFGIHF